jgi:hypothetical protein
VSDTPVRMPKAPRLPPLDSQAQAYHQAMADDPE